VNRATVRHEVRHGTVIVRVHGVIGDKERGKEAISNHGGEVVGLGGSETRWVKDKFRRIV
jgi:hypothetical protein